MRTLAVIGFGVLALTLTGSVLALPKAIILQVDEVPLAWGESRLNEKLTTALARDPDLRVVTPADHIDQYPACPSDHTNLDSLLDWGVEVGGRYLLTIAVDREGLESRKSFSVPLLFHRWEAVAVLAGEIRLLDLQKRRLLVAEPFEEQVSAARQFQSSTDDDSHDPALHVSAMDKANLFGSLEDRFVEHLMKKIRRLTRGY